MSRGPNDSLVNSWKIKAEVFFPNRQISRRSGIVRSDCTAVMSGQGWLASVSPVARMSNTANISQSLPRKQLEAAVWWTQSPKAHQKQIGGHGLTLSTSWHSFGTWGSRKTWGPKMTKAVSDFEIWNQFENDCDRRFQGNQAHLESRWIPEDHQDLRTNKQEGSDQTVATVPATQSWTDRKERVWLMMSNIDTMWQHLELLLDRDLQAFR